MNQTDDRDLLTIRPIAYIHSPFPEKFGIPRQSGLSEQKSRIVFVPEFRSVDAVRGLEGFDYLWMIWCFSKNLGKESSFHPTVRPPRLGGNQRMGVFATRSSFRPNGLALSSVRIESVNTDCADAPAITVTGADLMDGTPIYDIKPYLPYADAHQGRGGFTDSYSDGVYRLEVQVTKQAESSIEAIADPAVRHHLREILPEIISVLKEDPRPSYQSDPERIYGMAYDQFNVKFRVEKGVVYILSFAPISSCTATESP